MSVLKRSGSKNWYIQFQHLGQTFIRSSRTTDKRVAEQIERKWRSEVVAGTLLGHKKEISLRDGISLFLSSKKGTSNHPNLISHSRFLFRHIDGSKPASQITAKDIERVVAARASNGSGPATTRHTLNLIRSSIRYLTAFGYSTSTPTFPHVKAPKQRNRFLSSSEEARLLTELDPTRVGNGLPPIEKRSQRLRQQLQDNFDLVVLLLDTGARYTEVSSLPWTAVDLKEKTITLWRPKVQNESVLYMTDRVIRVLSRRQQTAKTFVFESTAGSKRGYITSSIRKAFRRAGLNDCRIHTLRHTFASRLVQNGMSIYEVKELLGHTDIKTTMRYAHIEQRDVSKKSLTVLNGISNQADSCL